MAITLVAQSAFANAKILVDFSIKPKICILTEQEEVCFDEIEARWKADEKISFCLYKVGMSDAINCWEKSQEGRYFFTVSTQINTVFELRDQENRILANTVFEVIRDNKKYRRSRRNPWSFF